ncbi:MAG: hypothetical protein ACJ8KX_03485 [Chthoniobacterales bacterium]
MKKLALALLCTFAFATWSTAAELSDSDKQFLGNYEKIRAALAADNLADAKKAAIEMGDDGAPIAKSESIITARKEFATMSDKAIEMTKGQSGYYRVNCPMVKKDWVQTSEKISNPYAGKEMVTCGVVKK